MPKYEESSLVELKSDGAEFDKSRTANQELSFLGKSKFTAIQFINKLLAEGQITKIGSARAVKYRINEQIDS
jgi:hypothetical protein